MCVDGIACVHKYIYIYIYTHIYIYIYKDKYLKSGAKIGVLQYEEILLKSQGPFHQRFVRGTTFRSRSKNNINKSLVLMTWWVLRKALFLLVFLLGFMRNYTFTGFPMSYIYQCLRCPWCIGYRRRKCTRRHEFKSWTRLIAFHIALIPLGKVGIQLFSLQLWVK